MKINVVTIDITVADVFTIYLLIFGLISVACSGYIMVVYNITDTLYTIPLNILITLCISSFVSGFTLLIIATAVQYKKKIIS